MSGRSNGGRGPGIGFRAAIVAAGAVLVASCASSAPSPSAPGASTPPAPSASGASAATPTGGPSSAAEGLTDIGKLVADAVASASPVGLSTADRAFQEMMDEQTGLTAALGPELHEWLREQRSAAAIAALKGRGLDPGALGPTGISTEPIASTTVGLTALTGTGWVGTAFLATVLVQSGTTAIGQSGSGAPQTSTVTGETTIGDQHLVTTTTTTTNLAMSGSLVIADADMTESTNVSNASTGAAIGSSTSHNHIHVEANMCPDASGGVEVTVTSDWSEDAGGMPGGSSFSMQSTMTIDAQVAEDAFLTSSATNANTTYTGSGAGGPQSGTMSTSWTQSMGPSGSVSQGTSGPVTSTATGNLSTNQAAAASGMSTILPLQIAAQALDLAQAAWRGGKCVEIQTSEQSRDVGRNEVIPFTAQARQKIEGVLLTAQVVASFSGVKNVDPVDTPIPGPAQFTFTAGPNKDDTGHISLKSTSRRGIGETALTFKVKVEGWRIDGTRTNSVGATGTVLGYKCGSNPAGTWKVAGNYEHLGFKGKQLWTIDLAAQPSGTTVWDGTYTYKDDSSGLFGVKQHTRTKGTVFGTLDDDGTMTMKFAETSRRQWATAPQGGTGEGPAVPQQVVGDFVWTNDADC